LFLSPPPSLTLNTRIKFASNSNRIKPKDFYINISISINPRPPISHHLLLVDALKPFHSRETLHKTLAPFLTVASQPSVFLLLQPVGTTSWDTPPTSIISVSDDSHVSSFNLSPFLISTLLPPNMGMVQIKLLRIAPPSHLLAALPKKAEMQKVEWIFGCCFFIF